ncbi:hypothetical protein MUP05_08280 [Candidatus Bathyarchaeota archaeon]|nr:hypothetical protein [Candidatus Bathyarchaeota archaeon]
MSTERKPDFKVPVLFPPPVMPLEEPEHRHEQTQSPGDDRGPMPWLLTASEEEERDRLLDDLRTKGFLTDSKRTRLAQLLSKKGLRDAVDASKVTMVTSQGDGSVFLPR